MKVALQISIENTFLSYQNLDQISPCLRNTTFSSLFVFVVYLGKLKASEVVVFVYVT